MTDLVNDQMPSFEYEEMYPKLKIVESIMQHKNSGFISHMFASVLVAITALVSPGHGGPKNKVIIVQDEMPTIEVLSSFLRDKGKLNVTIVDQKNLPQDLSSYGSVIGYIHGKLEESVEVAVINYTKQGGRYICLHHSISSGKAKNKYYFDFLGIQLDNPKQAKHPVDPGQGYGWVEGEDVALTLVNLNSRHNITNHQIRWGDTISYMSSDGPSAERHYPSISLPATEVYMNHKFIDGREKTVLCGFKFLDKRNNQLFMQDRAVWLKPYGKGDIIYIMPGHTPADYKDRNISQMILNATQWTP